MKDKKNIIILGVSGMLGSMILDVLSKENYQIVSTVRDDSLIDDLSKKYKNVVFKKLDAETFTVEEIKKTIGESEWIINAIGVIKPYIHEGNSIEIERAIKINSLFPHLLAKAIEGTNKKVIQIATDCVYSGQKGHYSETDLHDAIDSYGKTKSLGEIVVPNFYNLRCSIIGPELKGHLSLMDWFLGQPKNATLNGYTNHKWNGITTYHFAKLCIGLIESDLVIDHLQHVIPNGEIAKANMLKVFAKAYDRGDIVVNPISAEKVVDRTLSTKNTDLNVKIWENAGYKQIPTVEEMILEMSKWQKKNQ